MKRDVSSHEELAGTSASRDWGGHRTSARRRGARAAHGLRFSLRPALEELVTGFGFERPRCRARQHAGSLAPRGRRRSVVPTAAAIACAACAGPSLSRQRRQAQLEAAQGRKCAHSRGRVEQDAPSGRGRSCERVRPDLALGPRQSLLAASRPAKHAGRRQYCTYRLDEVVRDERRS